MLQAGELYKARLKRRFLNNCLTALIGGPVICLSLFLLINIILPGIDSARKGQDVIEGFSLLILGIGIMALLIVIAALVAWITTRNRSRELDSVFKALGLEGSAYMLYGRQYHGNIDGRAVDVFIYRGPTVEIHTSTTSQAGLQVFDRDSIQSSTAKLLTRQPVTVKNQLLMPFSIFANDEDWAGRMLDNPGVVEAIQALMNHGADWAIFRRVEFQPGEVIFNLYRSKSWLYNPVDLEEVRIWLANLQTLSEAAEKLPNPQIVSQPSVSTPGSRQKKSNFLTIAVIVIIFGLPLCAIGVGIVAYLFAIYQ